jgi:DNA-binding transcriptional ArsR family regulator
VVAKELAKLLGALAHPHRIRIVEELRAGELDVNSLQRALGISHSSVSQNLAVLRAQRVVKERKEGRHVFYSLAHPGLAAWLMESLQFLERGLDRSDEVRGALASVRGIWGESEGN